MGLTHHHLTAPARRFKPFQLRGMLGQIRNDCVSNSTQRCEPEHILDCKKILLNQVDSTLGEIENHSVLGETVSFHYLKVAETLAITEDKFIRVSANLISFPILEGLFEHDDFYQVVQGFFLKRKIFPEIRHGAKPSVVLVKYPGIFKAAFYGYPPAKQIKQEFEALTDLSVIKGTVTRDADYLRFSIDFVESDEKLVDNRFIRLSDHYFNCGGNVC